LTIIDAFSKSSRDEWGQILQSYKRVFNNTKDVELTVINRRCDVASHKRYSHDMPKINVVDGDMKAEELMRDYYWTHDCMIKYSREGWGLPVLEAMACGMLVIHNGSTGQQQYLTGKNSLAFSGGKFSENGQSLFDGDVEKMEKWMLHAYQGKGTDCKEAGRKTAERLNWSNFTRSIIQDIEATDEYKKALG
jgi:glycosyltransferase involved in cell wall biosynthesis